MDRDQLLNDNEEAMRLILDGRQSCLWTALPGIIESIDFSTMTCVVQPTIQGSIEDENGAIEWVNLPLLPDVPICFPSGGGFIITLPLKVNDEVLVIIASRCIDAWWQSGGVQKPLESRMHDLSDAFLIPGPRSIPKITGMGTVSTTGAQVRNDAGSTYLEISGDGKIKLVSPTEIDITAPTVSVTGALNVSGGITDAGIGLTTHKHLGVTTGSGTSGVPTP